MKVKMNRDAERNAGQEYDTKARGNTEHISKVTGDLILAFRRATCPRQENAAYGIPTSLPVISHRPAIVNSCVVRCQLMLG